MKTFKVLPHMCNQQRHEIDSLLHAADEIGAAAVTAGAHGYILLVEARTRFREILLEIMQHTRICLEEDEEKEILTH